MGVDDLCSSMDPVDLSAEMGRFCGPKTGCLLTQECVYGVVRFARVPSRSRAGLLGRVSW